MSKRVFTPLFSSCGAAESANGAILRMARAERHWQGSANGAVEGEII